MKLREKLHRMAPRTRARWLGTFAPAVLTAIYGYMMAKWMWGIYPVLNGDEPIDAVMTTSQLTGYAMTLWLGMSMAFFVWLSVKIFGNRKDRLEIEARL